MSSSNREKARTTLAEDIARFEASGGQIEVLPWESEPLPLYSAPKKTQAVPVRKKKEKPKDTPQLQYTFKDQVVRVVINEQGQPEFVLVDVADAIGAYREGFPTRFEKSVKTQRKVVTRGRVAIVSFSTVPEVIRVVNAMSSKKPDRRATFESFVRLVQKIDQEAKGQAVA